MSTEPPKKENPAPTSDRSSSIMRFAGLSALNSDDSLTPLQHCYISKLKDDVRAKH
ncbi:hypothetical protein GJ744_009441 [Endocarpon pusillum]|uniref:Uncharacterized protein n=1 Tax=Endocarpon pusillum TaxID=364733 RepID=A0A8H7AJR2_9EURO|nr:hypothetical protein GJ744_009441 [Endocarpon pusillum]